MHLEGTSAASAIKKLVLNITLFSIIITISISTKFSKKGEFIVSHFEIVVKFLFFELSLLKTKLQDMLSNIFLLFETYVRVPIFEAIHPGFLMEHPVYF